MAITVRRVGKVFKVMAVGLVLDHILLQPRHFLGIQDRRVVQAVVGALAVQAATGH
jgi:hypothetical protein